MSLVQLQDYVFTAKYARWRADLGRRETWAEAVDRVMAMHARRYAGRGIDAELEFARQAMLERLALGSQRALQFGGAPIEAKHARLYNCTVSHCDRPRFFAEALWLLLCGCGVGFSVQRHHVARLPELRRPGSAAVAHVVDDTIEGWADALDALLAAHFADRDAAPPCFDFSRVRPEGAALSSGIAAPGPAPLARALDRVAAVLARRRAAGGRRLEPIDCYDIVMHASDAVLSGGHRRSATLCLFTSDDAAMAAAKTGDWFVTDPQRGRSNNSALLLRQGTRRADFDRLLAAVRGFGEPGVVWADSTEIVYNPCAEIGMWPVDPASGQSGWAFCNLSEINCKACTTPALFARAARAAAILGTVQAGYADFPWLGAVTERIVRREALLGVSLTGMMDNPGLAFDPALQRELAGLVLATNADLARRLGIEPAARATCVKPAGTTSVILGTAAGIHAHHARRYLRRVQANRNERPLRFFAARNPAAVEPSVWSRGGTDQVITFCIEVPEVARIANDLSAIDLLDHVRLTQQNWVAAGRRPERCAAPWLHHNVSNTITVREHEWDAVAERLWRDRDVLAGVSLLPWGGDLDYPQAPFVAVWSREEIVARHGAAAVAAAPALIAAADAAFAPGRATAVPGSTGLWPACAALLGTGAVAGDDAQRAWLVSAASFADAQCGGDRRAATLCLKRVQVLAVWDELRAREQPVDWTRMHEVADGTGRVVLDPACVGGTCAL